MCVYMRGFRICICRVYLFYVFVGFFSFRYFVIILNVFLGLIRDFRFFVGFVYIVIEVF